jgi:hypothetical protein
MPNGTAMVPPGMMKALRERIQERSDRLLMDAISPPKVDRELVAMEADPMWGAF